METMAARYRLEEIKSMTRPWTGWLGRSEAEKEPEEGPCREGVAITKVRTEPSDCWHMQKKVLCLEQSEARGRHEMR